MSLSASSFSELSLTSSNNLLNFSVASLQNNQHLHFLLSFPVPLVNIVHISYPIPSVPGVCIHTFLDIIPARIFRTTHVLQLFPIFRKEDHNIEHFRGYHYLKFILFTLTKSSWARTTLFTGTAPRFRLERRTTVWMRGLFEGMSVFYEKNITRTDRQTDRYLYGLANRGADGQIDRRTGPD